MDKVKMEFKAPEKQTRVYNGIEYELDPFLTSGEQIYLINNYVETYFSYPSDKLVQKSEYAYIEAEYGLFNLILMNKTNIDATVGNFSEELFSDVNFVFDITGNILNYNDFRSKLNYVVNEMKQQESLRNSIGKVLSDLVDKAYEVLGNLTNITPEELAKMQQSSLDLLQKVEESSILGKAAPEESKAE